MVKVKSAFVCSQCGNDSPKWLGKCPVCGEWNTYVEEIISKQNSSKESSMLTNYAPQQSKPILLQDVNAGEEIRMDTGDQELNRVLGGGLVPGSLILIGGEPGIGKSTLVLQTVLKLESCKILYVSGEESAKQLKLRAERLGNNNGNLYIVCETNLEQVFEHINNLKPDLLVIDSIQTIYTERVESSPGSVTQVRECSVSLLKFAKETNTPTLLIGHIN
ncbi:MAG: AAA family ATPase, partial [Candidatus Azobacteroides sp.]|nr:AAA family ATPase [Candidatus Azobacteroides sp.]